MDAKRFHVRSVLAARPAGRQLVHGFMEVHGMVEAVAVRCTVCGRESDPFGLDGDAVLLSELDEWASQHVCALLRVA